MVNRNWTGAVDGNWEIAGNWNPVGIPAVGDDAILSTGFATLSTTITVNSIVIGGSNQATLSIKNPGGTATVTGSVTISGTGRLVLDAPFIGGTGGNSLTIGGVLTNSSTDGNALVIGNTSLTSADTVTATGLANTGRISLFGSAAAQSTLKVTGGVAGFGTDGVVTGAVYLERNALIEFAGGQIGKVAAGASLWLNGANTRVADAGATSTNSALVGLSTVAGDLFLQNGATIATSGGLTISGTGRLTLDASFLGGAGGSSLTIGGVLTNSSTDGNALVIGNTSQTSADTVTATGLANTGRISLFGSAAAQSTLKVTGGVAGFGTDGVVTGSVYLEHNALIEFAGGQIGKVAAGASLRLNGANTRVADAGATSTNSALVGLSTVAGDLFLQNGATIATSGGLTISGTGRLVLDAPFIGGDGGTSLTVGGVLTNTSTDGNALVIGSFLQSAGDTVTATGLVNTGRLSIIGSTMAQSTLNITGGVAGFGSVGVMTGSAYLERNALLQFASGQISTIKAGSSLWLNGANTRVADAGATSTNSALVGLSTVAGDLFLQNGATVVTSGDLTISGTGRLVLDPGFIGGAGGSTLTVGGVLSNTSTDSNALVIGSAVQFASSTVTVAGLVNTGRLAMSGNTSAPTTLTVTGGPAGFGSAGVVTGSVYLEHDALLQFASGQIGTVNAGASLWLNGASARVADAGATSTSSALVGLKSVAGDLVLQNGGTIATSGDLTVSGTGRLLLDAPFLGGVGRSSLTVGGVLTNNSADGNAVVIGNSFITSVASVTAAGLVNTGTIQLFGSATAQGSLSISGPAQNSGTIFVNAGGLLTDPLSLTSSGALKLAGGTIDVPTVTLARTGTLSGNGTIDGSVVNGGSLEATGGLLDVSGTISGNGVIKIGANATLELGSGSPLAILFNGASATLRLDTPGDFKGTIVGFDAQDKIDLRGVAGGTSATLDAEHVLHVFNAGKVELAALQLTASNAGQSFTVGSDGSGGTLITGGAITVTAPVYNGVFRLFGLADFDYTSMFPDQSLAIGATLSNIDAGGLRQKYVVSYNNGIQVEFDGAGLTLGAGGKFDPAGGTVDTVIVSVLGAGGQTTKLASFTSDAANGHTMLEKFNSTILSGGSGYYERLLSGDNSIIGSQNDDFIVDYWGINTIDGSGGHNTLYFGPAVTYLHVTSGNQPTDPLGIGSVNFIDDWGSSSFSNVDHIAWDDGWPYGPPPDAEPPGLPPDDDDGVDDFNDHNDAAAPPDNQTPNDGGGGGDPHLLTFDGSYYDFMAVGEFVMAKSTIAGDSFEVQIRTSAFAGSNMVSAISEIAVKIGNQRVTFDQSRPEIVWVDGSPVSFVNNTYALAGGRIDLAGQGRYDVVDNDGAAVHVLGWGAYFDVRVSPGDGFPLSKMQGLLGNADGVAGNDFALEDGTVLAAPLTSAQLYGVFADAWRVEQATSLLDYAAGQSTATFTNKSFPQNAIADLPLDLVTRATILATQAGITDPGLRQQAVLDYIATGDPTLITLAANQQQHGFQTVTIVQPTGGASNTVALGIAAVMSEVVETQSGTTGIAFQVYRTGSSAGNLAVNYKVTAPGAGYFDASDFGGALPSSQVNLLDGQSSTTFTINIPNNVITAASEFLRVEISATGGTPIFASTAQVEVHNNQPVAGSHANPAFLKFQGLGTLTHVGDVWTLDLGALVQGQTVADMGISVANLVASPGNSLAGTFGSTGNGFTLTGANAFTGLAAGAEKAFSVGVDTSILGARSMTLTLHASESNDTGFSAALGDQTLTISSTIVAAGTAVVSIAAASADKAEGNNGTTAFTFTVTRSGDTSGAQTVAWSIVGSGVNGASPNDFGAGPLDGGTVTFAAGETVKTVSIPVAGDTAIETDEQFTISLKDPTAGLTIATGSAIGTIRNDDGAPPTVAIAATAAVKTEGSSGTTAFTFTVTRTGSAAASATVSYAVTGSVTNPADAADFAGNALPSGVVTFAAGETTKTLSIGVAGDATVETDNGFIVTLANPSAGLTLGAATANGTILNDDLGPHDDAYVILQGKSLTALAAVGVLSNDETTPPVTATLQANATHGQLQLGADGAVTYTPTGSFAGIDTFSYHASGANGAAGDGEATVYIVPVQQAGTSTTLNLLALTAEQQIASTYAAFFGRAADSGGFGFWVGQFVQNLPTQGAAALFSNIASSFGISDEAKALYPFLVSPFTATDGQISAFLDSVYNNLFNRSSDAGGLGYWTDQIKQTLQAGQFVGSVLINIMSGAQDTAAGKDITTLMGKVAVSIAYVHEQQEHGTVWGVGDTAAATALLDAVTDAPQAILTGIRNAETLIANHV